MVPIFTDNRISKGIEKLILKSCFPIKWQVWVYCHTSLHSPVSRCLIPNHYPLWEVLPQVLGALWETVQAKAPALESGRP